MLRVGSALTALSLAWPLPAVAAGASSALTAAPGRPAGTPAAGPAAVPPSPAESAPSSGPLPSPTHALTAGDLSAFLDGIVPQQLAREDIAGAAVAVVKDGQVLLARGYGWADVEKKTPVAADATLFRPGSISKLFTWTAVMQLVERRELDLERDVNAYLDFHIPDTYPQPITLRHLMTHTAGFEEVLTDIAAGTPGDLRPLREYLVTHLPRRIFAPGAVPAYSNYGATLAGYLVERVAGVPFETYVEREIFAPLGMAHSTFAQPLPPALAPLASRGYLVASRPARPFELVQVRPAGALSATATDLARFMIAHLHDGRLGDARILQPETVRTMHARQFGLVPDLNGMALGFYEESRNGLRIIGHGGDTVAFHSDLHLIPEAGLGFFVAYNSAGKGEVSPRRALWWAFLDRYFPSQAPARAPPAESTARLVAGNYLSTRRIETGFFTIASSFGVMPVEARTDGRLTTPLVPGPNGEPLLLREVAPLRFESDGGERRIAFVHDTAGGLVLVPDFPIEVFQRAPWYEGRGVLALLLAFVAVVLALAALSWPVAALVRRHYGRPLELGAREQRLRVGVRLVGIGVLGVLAAWTAYVALGMQDLALFGSGAKGRVHLMQVATGIIALGALAGPYHAYRTWRRPRAWLGTRILETVVALACLAFVWIVLRYQLLRFGPTF